MQSAMVTLNPALESREALRMVAHDLRNLFAVVASAKYLLDRPLNERTKATLVDALCRVAADGKTLTDGLLAGGLEDGGCGADAHGQLQNLGPLLDTLEGPELRIELTIGNEALWILMPPAEFRAVVLELVTNAARAGAHTIKIRAARREGRFWLTVADDGAGFADGIEPLARSKCDSLHGNGLRRLASAVGSAHGSLRIKSKFRHGSVVAMILPIVRLLPAARLPEEPPGPGRSGDIPETIHGKCSAR